MSGKGIVLLIVTVLTISLTVITAINQIQSSRIDSWLERAKDAGNPQQVAEFLMEYKDDLYQDDRVDGKYTSIIRKPGTYMPTYIRAIDGLIIRAQDLAKQNSTDTSYQMGLVNLEKDLGDIEIAAWSVWRASGGWVLLIMVIVGWLVMCILGISLVA